MTSRVPPLLEQYLALPPEEALVVLSSVLGASTNWLVLRYLSSLLGRSGAASAVPGEPGDDAAILLVSFLRDYSFWRDGASRLGIDLESLRRKGRFSFVDGLTDLFSADGGGSPAPGPPSMPSAANGSAAKPDRTLVWNSHQGVGSIAASLLEALGALRAAGEAGPDKKLVLVVDQPEALLLAAGGAGAEGLRGMLLDLREQAHACVVALSADEPLVARQQTTLERAHASLLLSLAHEADMLLSLRLLDTGTANDVSGVLRITRGGGGGTGDPGARSAAAEEHEYLYHIGGDGGVRIFERGQ